MGGGARADDEGSVATSDGVGSVVKLEDEGEGGGCGEGVDEEGEG